jgi:hypothetical protein
MDSAPAHVPDLTSNLTIRGKSVHTWKICPPIGSHRADNVPLITLLGASSVGVIDMAAFNRKSPSSDVRGARDGTSRGEMVRRPDDHWCQPQAPHFLSAVTTRRVTSTRHRLCGMVRPSSRWWITTREWTLITGRSLYSFLVPMAMRGTTRPAAVPTQAERRRPRVVLPRWTDTVRVTTGDLQRLDCR